MITNSSRRPGRDQNGEVNETRWTVIVLTASLHKKLKRRKKWLIATSIHVD